MANHNDHFKKPVDSAKKELMTIIKKIDGLKLTTRAAKSWNIYKQLRGTVTKFHVKRKHVGFIFLLSWVSYYFVKNYINGIQYKKVKFLFIIILIILINYLFIYLSQCLIEPPDLFQKIFRPAEDCSMCQNIQQVEKLANIDPDYFEQR